MIHDNSISAERGSVATDFKPPDCDVAAYVITDLDVFDVEHYLAYQQALRPLLSRCRARYLVRGGPFRVIEGDYEPHRLVIIEFPSRESVDAFYSSDDYLALEDQRLACSRARIIVVEGL